MKKGFTLAEILITLAIIGIVAAITIPSVIVNTQQNEFRTGLRKAVSVLNQAITMAAAEDSISPYDIYMTSFDVTCMMRVALGMEIGNSDSVTLYDILSSHMSIIQTLYSVQNVRGNDGEIENTTYGNIAFYTTDGMRFEIPVIAGAKALTMHEVDKNGKHYKINLDLNRRLAGLDNNPTDDVGQCGSYGLKSNPNETRYLPCIIMVDVNGDRKPNPSNYTFNPNQNTMEHSAYTFAGPDDKRIQDVFAIMITESKAIPYGVAAQRAMYQARGNKKKSTVQQQNED